MKRFILFSRKVIKKYTRTLKLIMVLSVVVIPSLDSQIALCAFISHLYIYPIAIHSTLWQLQIFPAASAPLFLQVSACSSQ